MNDTTQTLVRSVLKIGAGYLLSKGVLDQSHSEELVSAIAGIIAILWGVFHRVQAPSSNSVGVSGGRPPLMAFWIPALILALWSTGCASNPAVVGHLVSVTDRGFGVNIVTADAANATPTIKLGFFSSQVVIEPVGTNKLTAPDYANTFAIDQAGAPFTFGVNETTASGTYQTGNVMGTNAIASQPIIAK